MQRKKLGPVHLLNTLVLVTILFGIWSVVAMPQNIQDEVQVNFELTDPAPGVGELVFITFTIRNLSNQDINADLGQNRKEAFRFSLQGIDGHLLKKERTLELHEFGPPWRVTIPAGSTYVDKLLLNEWLMLDTPGRFKLIAALDTEIQTFDTIVNVSRSQEIEITVLPRDTQRLRENFQNLLTEALAPTSEERIRAAEALHFANDEEAVPFLTKLLESEGYKGSNAHLAIEPLARIGTTNAGQGLIAALDSGNPDLVKLAKGGLHRLLRETSNPEVRLLIQGAFQKIGEPFSAQ